VETARTISQAQANGEVLEVGVPLCRQCEEQVPYPNVRKPLFFGAAVVFLGLFLLLLDLLFGVAIVLVLGGFAVMAISPPIIWHRVGPAFISSARSGSHYYVRRIRFKNPEYQALFDEANKDLTSGGS
jgi:protein-S-isoprenylcysteine O-methyltransferase Ste14